MLAVDLRGFGETSMNAWRVKPAEIAGDNGAEFYITYMMGRSLAGSRAEDILAAAKAFAGMFGAAPSGIDLVALEDAAVPALHAAAVEPTQFSTVSTSRAIDSWQRVIEATVPRRQLEAAIHGVLHVYDLPDLVALAGRVKRLEAVDGSGARVN